MRASSPEPRISFVIPALDEHLVTAILRSFASSYQLGVDTSTYELIVVAQPSVSNIVGHVGESSGVHAELIHTHDVAARWLDLGTRASRGQNVAYFGAPGIASPLLVASLCAALDTYPESMIAVRTFELGSQPGESLADWLSRRSWPSEPYGLVHEALESSTTAGNAYRWLDLVSEPANVAVSRRSALALTHASLGSATVKVPKPPECARVQLIGDALVRPAARGDGANETIDDKGDPGVSFFGSVAWRESPKELSLRPVSFRRERAPRLSVVVVAYNMRREAPRGLASLLPGYQRGLNDGDVEIILVDNGSEEPLSPEEVQVAAPGARYFMLKDPPRSPAFAINHGAAAASGDALAIVADAAHIMSPGLLATGLSAFRAFPRPVVITRKFFLGPGEQVDTVPLGYDALAEDRLLREIRWPEDGYRLFEISAPDTQSGARPHWLSGWFESECLFLPRSLWEEIGGCDPQFDYPGGGCMAIDLLFRACHADGAQLVQLLGEGAFHQVHGASATNTDRADRDRQIALYFDQYKALRGGLPRGYPRLYFTGALPSPTCRSKMDG